MQADWETPCLSRKEITQFTSHIGSLSFWEQPGVSGFLTSEKHLHPCLGRYSHVVQLCFQSVVCAWGGISSPGQAFGGWWEPEEGDGLGCREEGPSTTGKWKPKCVRIKLLSLWTGSQKLWSLPFVGCCVTLTKVVCLSGVKDFTVNFRNNKVLSSLKGIYDHYKKSGCERIKIWYSK